MSERESAEQFSAAAERLCPGCSWELRSESEPADQRGLLNTYTGMHAPVGEFPAIRCRAIYLRRALASPLQVTPRESEETNV